MTTHAPTAPALARHSVRQGLLEPEKTYTLYPDRLMVECEGRPPELHDLSAVRRVHLSYDRSKQREYYHCQVETDRGRVRLRHVHFAGPLNFEDRRATYTPFVLNLLQQLERYPGVRMTSGSWFGFVFLLLLIPFIGAAMWFAASIGRWGYFAVFALMMLVLLANLGRARPRTFAPAQPPRGLIPM